MVLLGTKNKGCFRDISIISQFLRITGKKAEDYVWILWKTSDISQNMGDLASLFWFVSGRFVEIFWRLPELQSCQTNMLLLWKIYFFFSENMLVSQLTSFYLTCYILPNRDFECYLNFWRPESANYLHNRWIKVPNVFAVINQLTSMV